MYDPLDDSPSKHHDEQQTWCEYLTCNFRRLHCPRDEGIGTHVKKLIFDDLENPKRKNPKEPRDKTALQKLRF